VYGKEADLFNSSQKTKECPGCAMETDSRDEVCPICGYEFPEQSPTSMIAAWLFIALILLWLIF
jgi:predicted amidophosphoribosyltransferase